MRNEVYVKFAEAVRERQFSNRANALIAAFHEQDQKIAEADEKLSRLQLSKQAAADSGEGLGKVAEYDGYINVLMIEKAAAVRARAGIVEAAAAIGLIGKKPYMA